MFFEVKILFVITPEEGGTKTEIGVGATVGNLLSPIGPPTIEVLTIGTPGTVTGMPILGVID